MSRWLRQHIGLSLGLLTALLIITSVGSVGQGWLHPIGRPLTSLGSQVGSWLDDLAHFASLRHQNQALQAQVINLQSQLASQNQTMLENDQLRALLNFKPPTGYNQIGADVVGYSPDGIEQMIRLNRGRTDGVAPGQAVLANQALVGVVKSVTEGSCLVQLVTDPTFRALVVTAKHQTPGIIIGGGPGSLTLNQIPVNQPVDQNEVVTTSGRDGVFGRGLLVGTIGTLTQSGDTIFQSATINLPVDLNRLTVVNILKPS